MRISDWSSDVCSSDLTQEYALATDGADSAFARGRVEIRNFRNVELAELGRCDDRKRQGMFGCPFDASCQPKNIILRKAGHRHDRGHGRAPTGQGAGLVDADRIDPLHSLQRLGILDQDAKPGASPDPAPTPHPGPETQPP